VDGRTGHVVYVGDTPHVVAALAAEVEITIRVSIEGDAYLVGKIEYVLGSLAYAQFYSVARAQTVAYAQGILDVLFGGVVGPQDACHSALGVLGVVVGQLALRNQDHAAMGASTQCEVKAGEART
jgi:hypothetical protein